MQWEDTMWHYDIATDVLFYVNQNPWTYFDPLGLESESERKTRAEHQADLRAFQRNPSVGGFFSALGSGLRTVGASLNVFNSDSAAGETFADPAIRTTFIVSVAPIAPALAAEYPIAALGVATADTMSGGKLNPLGSGGSGNKKGGMTMSPSLKTKQAQAGSINPGGPRQTKPGADAASDVTVPKDAAASLPQLKGNSVPHTEKTLTKNGFQQTRVSNSAAKNQTWTHADGSEVRIHPYGNQNRAPHKSANNAHVHKQNPGGAQLNDRGAVSTDPNATHIGIRNPKDLPQVRGRPHGDGD